MKRETLLTFAVVMLLALNLATLGFLYWTRSHPDAKSGAQTAPQVTSFDIHEPGDMASLDTTIVNRLHLDSTQQKKFGTLKREHHSTMMLLDSTYRSKLRQYFDLLHQQNFSSRLRDSIEAGLAKIQAQRASATFDHFQALKELCFADSAIAGANRQIAGAASKLAAFDSLLPLLEKRLMRTHIEWTPPGYPHPMPLIDDEDVPGVPPLPAPPMPPPPVVSHPK